MQTQEFEFTGEYEENGAAIFKRDKLVTERMSLTGLNEQTEYNNKMLETAENAIKGSELTMQLNANVLDKIKAGEELADNDVEGAKLYFEKIIELKKSKEYKTMIEDNINYFAELTTNITELSNNIPKQNEEITGGITGDEAGQGETAGLSEFSDVNNGEEVTGKSKEENKP